MRKRKGKKKLYGSHWHCVYTGHKYWFFHLNVGMWIKSLCNSFVFFHLLLDLDPCHCKAEHMHTHHYRILFQGNFISWYFFILSFAVFYQFWAVSFFIPFIFPWRLDGYRCSWCWRVVSIHLIACIHNWIQHSYIFYLVCKLWNCTQSQNHHINRVHYMWSEMGALKCAYDWIFVKAIKLPFWYTQRLATKSCVL